MNKLLVVSISLSTFYQALGAPAPQQFQTQSYQTHSIYPSYSVQHQTIPLGTFPPLSPHPVGLNSVHLNANEQKKLESNYQEILEKFKSENSHPKADGPTNLVSGKTLSNVDHSKSTVSGLELTSLEHHHADPVFGPEIGSKYDIHYAPEHLISLPAFSEYAGYPIHAAFPAQPVFPSAYTDFSSYPEYPHFGGSNTFVSAAAAASPSRGLNIAIDPPPKVGFNPFLSVANVDTPQRDPNLAINPPPKEDASNGGIANGPETSNSNDSTTEANIGAPPSIDGPKPERQEENSQDAADSSSSNKVKSEKKAVKTSEKKAVKT